MMGQYRNVEWLTQNLNRNYPLKETSSRVASVFRKLPNEFIADILLTGTAENTRYFISEITLVAATTIEIVISDFFSNPVVQFDIPVNSAKFAQYFPSQKFNVEVGGRIVIGEVKEMIILLDSFPLSFAGSATELEPSTLGTTDKDIRVTSASSLGITPVLRGDIKFEGEDGIEVTQNQAENKIIIGFEDPAVPANCDCPPNFPDIKRINGVDPDCSGNFSICGEGVITVSQKPSGICISSIIDPNEICAIIGASGIPGPPGPPGVGLPGPPGPAGPTIDIECDSECASANFAVDDCIGDDIPIVVCSEIFSPPIPGVFVGPTLFCDPPDPFSFPPKPQEIDLVSPVILFGELLQASKIIKCLLEFKYNIKNYLDGVNPPPWRENPKDNPEPVPPGGGDGEFLRRPTTQPGGRYYEPELNPITSELEYNIRSEYYTFGDLLAESATLQPAIDQCFNSLNFKVGDNLDPTKKVKFDLSGLLTGECVTLDIDALDALLLGGGGGGGGEANTNSNAGGDACLVKTKVGVDTPIKCLTAGEDIKLTENVNEVVISHRKHFSSDAIKVGSFSASENAGIYRVDISAGSGVSYTMTLPGLTGTPTLLDGDIVHAVIDAFNPPFFNNSLTAAVAAGSSLKYSFQDIGPEGTSFKFSYCADNNTWYQIG